MTREEMVKRAGALIAEGMRISVVARVLDVNEKTLRNYLNDPDGSKSRRRKLGYGGVCVDCGGPTAYGGKLGNRTATRCQRCRTAYVRSRKKWTREKVVAAIRLWAEEHDGVRPVSSDWSGVHDPRFPALSSVYGRFGVFDSWADAVEAAGFGRPRVGVKVHARVYTRQIQFFGKHIPRVKRDRIKWAA